MELIASASEASQAHAFEPMVGLQVCEPHFNSLPLIVNYLIDIENAVIVDVEATPARTYDEVKATKTMIERTEQRLGLTAAYLH